MIWAVPTPIRLAVPSAFPLSGNQPYFVVEQPLASPRHCGVRDVHVGRPLSRKVQAQLFAWERMRQFISVAVELELRCDDSYVG